MKTLLKLSTPETHRTSTILDKVTGKAFARVYAGDETSRDIIRACNRAAVGHGANCMAILEEMHNHTRGETIAGHIGGRFGMFELAEDMAGVVSDWEAEAGPNAWENSPRDWETVACLFVDYVFAALVERGFNRPNYSALFQHARGAQ